MRLNYGVGAFAPSHLARCEKEAGAFSLSLLEVGRTVIEERRSFLLLTNARDGCRLRHRAKRLGV